ncbi:MAG TPA: polysaccharide biosynthesis tyrosine autokinase, partial [Methylomirabilota bacterium]|nr:polysaccharide biosynthesis tyrosine autokinase [Methylomirabilota bacterium]
TRLAALKQKLESQKPAPAGEPAAARPAGPQPNVLRMQGTLAQLESQLLELNTKYTDEHPRVLLVKDRINELQRQIAATIKEITPVTPAPGVVASSDRVSFANSVLALEASLVTLGAQEEALSNQAAILKKNLSGLSGDEHEYSRLGRDLDSNQRLYSLISEKLSGARIREQGEMQQVKVIDPPTFPTPVPSSNTLALFGITLMVSLAVGLGIPALVEYAAMPADQEDDILKATNLPVLGAIPAVRKNGQASTVPGVVPLLWSRRAALPERTNGSARGQQDDLSFFIEAFRRTRSSIQLATMDRQVKSLLVLSPFDQEGKSTVLFNLGMSFWEIGKRVILADADFYRPTLHKSLKVSAHAGFVDFMKGQASLQHAMVPVAEGLWVSTRGSALPAQGRGMLTSARVREVVDEMSREADMVFIDSSPLLIVPDNLFLAASVDAVILVAKAGETRLKDLSKCKELLDKVGANVLGVVLNEVPLAQLKQYYKRYYRSYLKKEEAK